MRPRWSRDHRYAEPTYAPCSCKSWSEWDWGKEDWRNHSVWCNELQHFQCEWEPRRIPPPPRPRRLQIPRLDLQGQDRGHLLEVLTVSGAVYLTPGWEKVKASLPVDRPDYQRWYELMLEATWKKRKWKGRQCVHSRHFRFSDSEDLSRTTVGEGKFHEADLRAAFGISESSAKSPFVEWGDLTWAVEDYRKLKEAVAAMFESEISEVCAKESGDRDRLGVKLRLGWETWGRSALRHCVYPANGTCSTHTDYGVLTVQFSNGSGLEAFTDGSWRALEDPPEGCALLFAGDMLERLTNGRIKALPHRVHVFGPQRILEGCARKAEASHVPRKSWRSTE
ncbi:unnamed protein product [Effrenium voratum]|nr:unnamed protein product [Effrenium voratum]